MWHAATNTSLGQAWPTVGCTPCRCSPNLPQSLLSTPPQAIVLQGQVKAQADKDVANYEAEWRQLTDMVEQERRAWEAQRTREIAAREQQMTALFKQEFSSGGKRRGSGRGLGASGEGGKSADGVAAVPATAPERVKQLKEAFARVLASTGGRMRVHGQAGSVHTRPTWVSRRHDCIGNSTHAGRPGGPCSHALQPCPHTPALPCPHLLQPQHLTLSLAAGASDVDELLDSVAAGEEANFSLFNYVNDLSGEVDKLEDGIAALR